MCIDKASGDNMLEKIILGGNFNFKEKMSHSHESDFGSSYSGSIQDIMSD